MMKKIKTEPCSASDSKNDENLAIELLSPKETQNSNNKISLKEVQWQVIFSLIAQCTVIQSGMSMGFSTILDDGIKTHFNVTSEEKSWLTSLFTLSLPFGSLIVGPLMDSYGRKKICLFCMVPCVVSWTMLIFSYSVTMIGIARMIAGFSAGLSTTSIIYISEITHPQIRPMLLSYNSTFVSFGILITYCLGLYFSWNKIAIVFLIFNTCIFFALLFIPESPYWLMCFGNDEFGVRKIKVEKVLKSLNNSKHIYDQELKRIEEIFHYHNSNIFNDSLIKKVNNLCKNLKSPGVYKPTIILLILFLIQQLTGAYVIIFYALRILQAIGGEFGRGLDSYSAMVMLGVIRFAMSIITSLFSKKFGRRILGISSCLGMAFAMSLLAVVIYIKSLPNENGEVGNLDKYNWISLVLLLFYLCSSCLGIIIIPWTLIGELFPTSVRGTIGGIMISVAYWIMSGILKNFPLMLDSIGAQGVFIFFSGSSVIGASYIYIFLPETLGKSFSDIEKYFLKKKNLSNEIL